MGAALKNAGHYQAAELRAMARREQNSRVASHMVAIAHALDGMKRVAAAELAGMDRQTLRDWVIRHNDHGVAGLADLPMGHNPEKLIDEEKAILKDPVHPKSDRDAPDASKKWAHGSARGGQPASS